MFTSIDEVVSGNSLVRVYKQFDTARTNYANRKAVETYGKNADFRDDSVRAFRDSVRDSIRYLSLAIVDSKMDRIGKARNPEYEALVNSGVVVPIKTGQIVTMDRLDFFPARYKTDKDSEGNEVYLPVIDHFDFSPKYIDFLQMVAAIVGKNPEDVTAHNLGKMRSSYQWVPPRLRKV